DAGQPRGRLRPPRRHWCDQHSDRGLRPDSALHRRNLSTVFSPRLHGHEGRPTLACMTVIVKASGPVDILAMVPSLVHMVPRNSVVFLAFRGKRTCGAMRFDLPAAATRTVQKRMITT